MYPIAAAKLTEVIHRPLPEEEDGRLHPDGAPVVAELAAGCSSLAVGSGLGRSWSTGGFMDALLDELSALDAGACPPVVFDADGLNNLSILQGWWQRLPSPAVLTPHPGEMATLTGWTTARVQRDRTATARRWALEWGVTLVLKGAGTIIARPEGVTRVSPFANPGLASGGTGDTLTGAIAGLMAQGLSPEVAADCGVFTHGQAGEEVMRQRGDAGTIASDLIEVFPDVIRRLKGRAGGW